MMYTQGVAKNPKGPWEVMGVPEETYRQMVAGEQAGGPMRTAPERDPGFMQREWQRWVEWRDAKRAADEAARLRRIELQREALQSALARARGRRKQTNRNAVMRTANTSIAPIGDLRSLLI